MEYSVVGSRLQFKMCNYKSRTFQAFLIYLSLLLDNILLTVIGKFSESISCVVPVDIFFADKELRG